MNLRFWLYRLRVKVYRFLWKATGIYICFYYLYKDDITEDKQPPASKCGVEDIECVFLGSDEMKAVAQLLSDYSERELQERLEEGYKCFGAKYQGQIISVLWIDFKECNWNGNRFKLNNDEAYIYDVFTDEKFRGKNLAPNVHYQVSENLKTLGIKTIYIIYNLANRPSIKYRRKLAPKSVHWLGFYIVLFRRIRWSRLIKKYES